MHMQRVNYFLGLADRAEATLQRLRAELATERQAVELVRGLEHGVPLSVVLSVVGDALDRVEKVRQAIRNMPGPINTRPPGA
jgi:hypothetical protein